MWQHTLQLLCVGHWRRSGALQTDRTSDEDSNRTGLAAAAQTCESVSRPSSRICSSTAKTSGCAFSTCNKGITSQHTQCELAHKNSKKAVHDRTMMCAQYVARLTGNRSQSARAQQRRRSVHTAPSPAVAPGPTTSTVRDIIIMHAPGAHPKVRSRSPMLRMTISHLVEEHDATGPPPHCLSQLATITIPHVPCSRAHTGQDCEQ